MDELLVHAVEFDDPAVRALLDEWDAELGHAGPGSDRDPDSVVTADDFAAPRGAFLLAVNRGQPAGCAGLRPLSPTVGEVKRMYVRRMERGSGIGRRLLEALEAHSAALGLAALRLDTDGGHPAALSLFRSLGYQPIPAYNGNRYARHWFEKPLGGTAAVGSD